MKPAGVVQGGAHYVCEKWSLFNGHSWTVQ